MPAHFSRFIVDSTSAGVLIELESPDAAPQYLVGLQNFYVLTRYNRSSFYASAVLELAAALKRRGTTLIEVAVGEMPDPWKVMLPQRVRGAR